MKHLRPFNEDIENDYGYDKIMRQDINNILNTILDEGGLDVDISYGSRMIDVTCQNDFGDDKLISMVESIIPRLEVLDIVEDDTVNIKFEYKLRNSYVVKTKLGETSWNRYDSLKKRFLGKSEKIDGKIFKFSATGFIIYLKSLKPSITESEFWEDGRFYKTMSKNDMREVNQILNIASDEDIDVKFTKDSGMHTTLEHCGKIILFSEDSEHLHRIYDEILERLSMTGHFDKRGVKSRTFCTIFRTDIDESPSFPWKKITESDNIDMVDIDNIINISKDDGYEAVKEYANGILYKITVNHPGYHDSYHDSYVENLTPELIKSENKKFIESLKNVIPRMTDSISDISTIVYAMNIFPTKEMLQYDARSFIISNVSDIDKLIESELFICSTTFRFKSEIKESSVGGVIK